ncbi:MAG: LLM class F420-dependent oxidoreductase [Acidimicrobiales bacterium]
MRVRIFTEPQQGATYLELLAVAQTAEECGFDGFFRSDHFLRMGGGDPGPGPTEAWVTLAGLARDTSAIRLGTLMTSATFRLPGMLAITVAEVDAMSGGRVELGLGAGWFEAEHSAYGLPFPDVSGRFDRLEEQLLVLVGLWSTPPGETYSFAGEHYRLVGCPALPKPAQIPHPPLIIGGKGRRRTPELAARFAAEFNLAFCPLDQTREAFERASAACEAADRDPVTLGLSAAIVVCCGMDAGDVGRRAAAIGREEDELREHGATGSPGQVVERIRAYQAIGADTVYLQILDLADHDHLRLIAEEVLPQLR